MKDSYTFISTKLVVDFYFRQWWSNRRYIYLIFELSFLVAAARPSPKVFFLFIFFVFSGCRKTATLVMFFFSYVF